MIGKRKILNNFKTCMKYLFNKLIIGIISYLPRRVILLFAKRYVAGENSDHALKVVSTLNRKGFHVTLDILGEHTKNIKAAREIRKEYQALIHQIDHHRLKCNISVKPSHLGSDISNECIENNMIKLIHTAKEKENFVRLDMEDSSQTDSTIQLYNTCKEHYKGIGIVYQAYLYRTEPDLKSHQVTTDLNFRLCKGIYKESEDIAIQGRANINNNFLKLLRYAFEHNIYVGIATHDLFLIKETYKLIKELEIKNDQFEFQVLYGVPMSGWLETHLKNKYKVRIYVPFGKKWYDYSIRRLKENPDIAGHILRNLLKNR